MDLNGRFFGGRTVRGAFFNLDKFRRLDLMADLWSTKNLIIIRNIRVLFTFSVEEISTERIYWACIIFFFSKLLGNTSYPHCGMLGVLTSGSTSFDWLIRIGNPLSASVRFAQMVLVLSTEFPCCTIAKWRDEWTKDVKLTKLSSSWNTDQRQERLVYHQMALILLTEFPFCAIDKWRD